MHATALPPGPACGPLAQASAFHRDPLGVLRAHQRTYGDVFTVRFPTARPLVVVLDPDAARGLAGADGAYAHAGAGRRRILPLASPRSAFGADGAQHRAARGRLAPAFAPAAIDPLRPAVAQLAAEHVARWPRGRPFRLLPRLRLVVDEAAARLVLGVEDPGRGREVARAIRRMLWTPGNPPLSPPGEGDGLLGVAGAAFARRRMAPLQQLLAEELERRRAAGDDGRDDVLGCLARSPLDARAAVDELLPVLMAAQEPIAAGLAWLLERLARHPELAGRWRAEEAGSPLRDAIVKETLRLRPPALAMLRRLTRPLRVGVHTLPAGVTVVVPILALHRDPRLHPEPDLFRPARWTQPGADDLLHVPFGGGVRRCLGEALAHAELASVTDAVLDQVDLRAAWLRPEKPVLRATILVPHRSALVVARARGR